MKKIITSLFLLAICTNIKAQTATITQLQQACNHDGKIVLTTSGITPPIIYSWYNGIVNKTDTSNSLTDTLKNYSGGMINAYAYSMGNSGGAANAYFYSPPYTYMVSTTNAICPALGSATVSITGGQAPFTTQWTNLTTQAVVPGGLVMGSLTAGPYQVEITDANGCVFGSLESRDSLYISEISNVQVAVATTTANCTDGTASVTSVMGAVAPYSYLWSNGLTSSSISNLITGYYYITLTDAQGCKGTNYGYVPQAVTINAHVVVTPATCVQNNGSAITFGSGGTSPYSYVYSNGQTTQTASGLAAGYYYVTATDAIGCISSSTFLNVNASTPITVTYSATPSSCTAPTGSATLTANNGQAPYTITWYTSPAQSGTIVSNLSPGTYQFNVTDANGCVQNGSVYIPPVSNLSAYPSGSNATCPNNNGSASVSAYSNHMPITYLWSNGATSPSISNLSAGIYDCVVTDALGCQLNKSVFINQTSTINLGFNTTDATCVFRNDGKINLTPTGGVAPYTYNWSNGQTTQNLTNLSTNNYYVSVSDANGCRASQNNYVGYNALNDSCYCTVTGKVFYDANGNCIKDNSETSIDNILIKNNSTSTAVGVNSYMFTDTAGKYSFILPSGNYNMQEVIQHTYPLSACQSNNNPITLSASHGCTYTVDFANTINPLHDVHIINMSMNLPVPGNNYVQQVVIQNDGTVAENNIQLGYTNDGQLNYTGSSAITLNQPNATLAPNWYDNTSTVPVLNPGQYTATQITYAVPTNIPLGTIINFSDSTAYAAPMSNWLNDYSPWNNVKNFDTVVVGSFDPNFKEVSPKGIGPLGLVNSTDTVFDYVIHFQNTGTAPANKIVVKDTIDADFVIESLKPGYSNHSYVASIDNHNVLTFTFNNINLPDMNNYPLGSIGVVSYSIHAKKNLAQGTQFKNSAAIYFDYNQPVFTNTTINTIDNTVGIKEIKSTDNAMSLFPNPTADNYSLKFTSDTETSSATINIYSLDGRIVSQNNINLNKGENVVSYSATNLASGLYIIRLTENGKQHITKLSVVK